MSNLLIRLLFGGSKDGYRGDQVLPTAEECVEQYLKEVGRTVSTDELIDYLSDYYTDSTITQTVNSLHTSGRINQVRYGEYIAPEHDNGGDWTDSGSEWPE